jgi:hypothetical protein
MGLARLTSAVVVLVLALAWPPLANAGGQSAPLDEETLTTATPTFVVDLSTDDVNPRIDVTTEDGVLVGSCVPAPTECFLSAPLANGSYSWTLFFQNRRCDGYMGEICDLVERVAGPRRLEVAVPRIEPRVLVLDRAIGAARLGMASDEAHALYGEPLRTRGATEVFSISGGILEITFTAGRATAVSTTSRYYRTSAGLGVGAKAPRGWRQVGRDLVRGRTRVTIANGRIVRVTVTSALVPARR